MEIEAHEFEPRPYDSKLCNECEYTKSHPLHALSRVLGIKNQPQPVWVDVGRVSDDRRECPHESFECTGPNPWVRHRCNDCNLTWDNNNKPGFVYCDICRDETYPPVDVHYHEEGAECLSCTPPKKSTEFVTKDSGKRESYDSGMVRDVQDDKPRFDLLYPVGVPYGDQFLTRVAGLLARGAEKYTERNWEKAVGEAELNRFRASALRHLTQYLCGETDEDHMAAVVFNLMGAHLVEWKMKNDKST